MNRWIVYACMLMLSACSEDKVEGPVPVQSDADAIKIGQSCSAPQFLSDTWTAQRDGKQWRVYASDSQAKHVLEVLINADNGQIDECTTQVN
jgi:hypothetical protein